MHGTPYLLPSAEASGAAAAEFVARHLRGSPRHRPLSIAVSGGRSTAPLYAALRMADVPWARLHVFWADERFVPSDHEDSNEALVRASLLDHVPVDPAHVHPVPTHLASPEAAADAYDARLREVLGEDGLTVVILGVGDDGHTASLFPGQPLDHPGRLAVHTRAPEGSPVRDRITLTREMIAASEHALVMAVGSGKREVVHEVLVGTGANPDRYPVAAIGAREGVSWFIDREAAGPQMGVALVRPPAVDAA